VEDSLSARGEFRSRANAVLNDAAGNFDVTETIRELEEEMLTAANQLEFEKAALLRDQIRELKRGLDGKAEAAAERPGTRSSVSYRNPRGGRKGSRGKRQGAVSEPF
jgi:excinuclease ABC subunit B